MGGNPWDINRIQRILIGKSGMLRVGGGVFCREDHTNWLFPTKWSILKTCIQVTLYRLNKLYLEIYLHTYTYMHVTRINKETWIRKIASNSAWETMEGGMGRVKWCDDISKIKETGVYSDSGKFNSDFLLFCLFWLY